MATWQQLRDEAPEMAAVADDRLQETGLVLVGTLRSDGWPRISPDEPVVMDGVLYHEHPTERIADYYRGRDDA